MPERAIYLNGDWQQGQGDPMTSLDPGTGEPTWQGHAATPDQVDQAVQAAREALPAWMDTSLDDRIAYLHAFGDHLRENQDALAQVISRDTGKPRWEALTEVRAMENKINLSIRAYRERRQPVHFEMDHATALTRFRPHGVLAVVGPFNLPGHLPNGHIVPALLAGNTVVFKPSEQAPRVAEKTLELWDSVMLPPGVLNMVQGGRATGEALARHPDLDGLLFTGSREAGLALHHLFADHPQKILALEMGGNNPLLVHRVGQRLDAAAYLTVLSAFITAGQRCTCARRLILPDHPDNEPFLDRLLHLMDRLVVGVHTDRPEPFMGPVISDAAAHKLLAAQDDLIACGGKPLRRLAPLPDQRPALLTPGLLDVTDIPDRPDVELFGPILQVVRVPDFQAGLAEANRTQFGLAAGLFSEDRQLFERFFRHIRAGVVNWNRQTTGASGALPFGGVGMSGNHRPSGYYAADYCAYPVASLQTPELALPEHLPPGVT